MKKTNFALIALFTASVARADEPLKFFTWETDAELSTRIDLDVGAGSSLDALDLQAHGNVCFTGSPAEAEATVQRLIDAIPRKGVYEVKESVVRTLRSKRYLRYAPGKLDRDILAVVTLSDGRETFVEPIEVRNCN